MTIERHDTGPRMSKAVVHGDTVYLAGIVADAPKGKSMGEQTKSILSQIDGFLAQGRHRQEQIALRQYLDHRHGEFRRDECGVGCLGVARQHAGARHGRGQARLARLQGRDHGGGGAMTRAARHPRDLQRLPRRARGGIRSLVPGRASARAARRAGIFVRPPAQGDFGTRGLFQFLPASRRPRCSPRSLISNGSIIRRR